MNVLEGTVIDIWNPAKSVGASMLRQQKSAPLPMPLTHSLFAVFLHN